MQGVNYGLFIDKLLEIWNWTIKEDNNVMCNENV